MKFRNERAKQNSKKNAKNMPNQYTNPATNSVIDSIIKTRLNKNKTAARNLTELDAKLGLN